MPDEGETPSPRTGQIVTFYSFKGGTGRTMALANVAWILAANGKRVLVADWDLESPGLHRFFQPFMDARASERPGIVDLVRRYAWAMVDAEIDPQALHRADAGKTAAVLPAISAMIDNHIGRLDGYVIPLSWQFPGDGALHFLSPGKQNNGDYQATLSALDWDNFYENLYGDRFLTVFRNFLKEKYDYVLIDSRTGHGDVADICTVHLPDMVIDCFTLTNQGIEGAAKMAREIPGHSDRDITILPVPMRIDHAEKEKVDAGLRFAASRFDGLPSGISEDERRKYWATVEVPYRPSYAYEETLATFYDRPGSLNGLLPYYERIVALITGGGISTLPPREEWLRLRTRLLFSRIQSSNPLDVVLDFSPEDQLWAEWVAGVLANAEITVHWMDEVPVSQDGQDEPEAVRQRVAIVSESYAAWVEESPPETLPDLLISVTEARVPAVLGEVPVVFLAGLPESRAADALIDRLNGRRPAEPESATSTLRYPGGDHAQVQNIPTRNSNFTGRNGDLRELREQLRQRRVAVFLPLTLHGLGGVGKTQVALEYAHRFRADYDVIWWMDCGQPQYVDASLADLGQQLRKQFQVPVPEEGGVSEVIQQVLRALSEGLPDKRWLLIYDNAEDVEELTPLLPAGGGHVLITSQSQKWQDIGTSLEVDKFRTDESVSHLRRRLRGITEADARRIADVLQDIPLAVAAAGALLAVTGMSVDDYLERLDQQPTQAYPPGHPLHAYAAEVAKAWTLSLDELERRSRAAARLLGICSVMAPAISQDLINSPAMAKTLRALDPVISEQGMIASLTRQIDLLALIKVDNNNRQIQVHRVVQAVVRDRMSEEETTAAREAVHAMVVDARPEGDVDDPQTWRRYRAIWPHLTPSEAMWSADTEVRQLLIERVRYIRQRDDLERGKRRALEIQRAWRSMLSGIPDPELPASNRIVTGKPDPEAAEVLRRQLLRLQFNLANILRALDAFDEARNMDQEVLDEQRQLLGPYHLHTLQTRGSLAADMRALGDYQAALDLDKTTYETSREVFGDDDRTTLNAANNLALSYLLTGRFRQALAQDRQTLERRSSVLGSANPGTLHSGSAVARDLLEAGRYEEAVSRMEAVWGQCVQTLGDNDRTTLNARLLLGVALRCVGKTEVAAPHIEQARVGLTRGFGRDSTDALAARLSQALNLLTSGQYRDARTAAEEVLAVYQERLGDSHPHSLICRLDIATALCLDEDFVNAKAEAETAANGLNERLGDDHPYTLAARMVLATVLARQDHLAEARDLEEQVVRARERVLREDHPDTLRCRANLLLTEQQLRVEGAIGKRQQVLATLGALIGHDHPDVTTALRPGRLLCAIDPLPY
jgi:MinD-like ATPase involved in chromosome partitioning or flagellar assembly/tetratricopeptide (TPR) repeat protein